MIIISNKIAGRLPKSLYRAMRRINKAPLQMGGLPALASNYIVYIANDHE